MIEMNEILDIAAYERVRDDFRKKITEVKKHRRIHLGEHFTLLIENKDTMLYQIQEMMRTERIVEEEAIAHEVKTYSALASTAEALKVTLLIEYIDTKLRDASLVELLGLEEHLFLDIAGDVTVKAVFDLSQIGTDRLSSVQYIEFPIGDDARSALKDAVEKELPVRFYSDHSYYNQEITLSDEQKKAIAMDVKAV